MFRAGDRVKVDGRMSGLVLAVMRGEFVRVWVHRRQDHAVFRASRLSLAEPSPRAGACASSLAVDERATVGGADHASPSREPTAPASGASDLGEAGTRESASGSLSESGQAAA